MRGFSLVELSLVLVILAFLSGSFLAGRHLIRITELQSIIREVEEHKAGIQVFHERYFHFPGDFSNATQFFGTAHNDHDTCIAMDKSQMKATCNGNGDHRVDWNEEMFLFWHHMFVADLLIGSYEGRHDPNIGVPAGQPRLGHTPGKNSPQAKFRNGTGYSIAWYGPVIGASDWFEGSYGHAMTFGASDRTNNPPFAPALTTQEAFQLDEKFDDGRPASGNIMTRPGTGSGTPNCTETEANEQDITHGVTHPDAVYRLNFADTPACMLIFRDMLE